MNKIIMLIYVFCLFVRKDPSSEDVDTPMAKHTSCGERIDGGSISRGNLAARLSAEWLVRW